MATDKISVFVSNVLLNYMFNSQVLSSTTLSSITTYWFSIEEYLNWAKFRMEKICYDYSDLPTTAQTIRTLDKKLLDIFPFMTRVPDRTYILTHVFNLFEEIKTAEEQKSLFKIDVETTVDKELHHEIVKSALKSVNTNVLDKELHHEIVESPLKSVNTNVLDEELLLESSKETESSINSSLILVKTEPEDSPIKSSKSTPKSNTDLLVSAPSQPVNIAQTTAKLRKEAVNLGIKNPFLLSISQLRSKFVLYNSGKLSASELIV